MCIDVSKSNKVSGKFKLLQEEVLGLQGTRNLLLSLLKPACLNSYLYVSYFKKNILADPGMKNFSQYTLLVNFLGCKIKNEVTRESYICVRMFTEHFYIEL